MVAISINNIYMERKIGVFWFLFVFFTLNTGGVNMFVMFDKVGMIKFVCFA